MIKLEIFQSPNININFKAGSSACITFSPPPGNILLNIIVQSSMPCTRVGKNNVMVVCVPNPPVDDKNPTTPVPLLIRVKTSEDADELHKILEEKKA